MLMALTHMAYFAVIVILASAVEPAALGELHSAYASLFIMGALGTWRYSWAAINFTRAFVFRHYRFPARRARAERRFIEQGIRSHCFMLVTTYMVDPKVTLPVYRSVFRAAANARDGATIVASVVDGADDRLIRAIFETMDCDMSRVKLIVDRIEANGKRDALAKTLKIIRRLSPTEHDILVFVDGDTMVPEDIWWRSAPVFTVSKVGALTTDEAVVIDEDSLFRDWFVLRFRQRQLMMCSMGLGNRVLTLTGRMSVFRASLATDPTFIRQVGQDFLEHWRLGRVNFLTGDDKSTWYWLLKNGYEMRYLPDVQSHSFEDQPRPTFFDSAKTLMVRWFGNMMRTNGRALRLPPRLIGRFTWWSILDQRVSMWTTLVGPITVAITAIAGHWAIVPMYVAWVMITRYIFCVIISLFNGAWFPVTHPFILYFGQIVGAAIKTFVFFRLDKQKWTRQATATGGGGSAFEERLKSIDSTAHHVIWLMWLTLAILFVTRF